MTTTAPHGTLTRRKEHHCQCGACKAADRAYANHRTRQLVYGQWAPYVDAEPVRAHLRTLAAHGVSYARAARLAGLTTSSVAKIIYGDPARGQAPTKRVRPATAQALLAVTPTLDALGSTVCVDGTGTRRRLQALVRVGWSPPRLARRLGMDPSNFGRTIHGARVRSATARAVAALYDTLWDTPPPQGTHREKIAATRARNQAAAAGWAPPAAWDDDTIDDPDARPDTGGNTSRQDALAEDAEWLLAQGHTKEQVAERLGITKVNLNKVMDRARAATGGGPL